MFVKLACEILSPQQRQNNHLLVTMPAQLSFGFWECELQSSDIGHKFFFNHWIISLTILSKILNPKHCHWPSYHINDSINARECLWEALVSLFSQIKIHTWKHYSPFQNFKLLLNFFHSLHSNHVPQCFLRYSPLPTLPIHIHPVLLSLETSKYVKKQILKK